MVKKSNTNLDHLKYIIYNRHNDAEIIE